MVQSMYLITLFLSFACPAPTASTIVTELMIRIKVITLTNTSGRCAWPAKGKRRKHVVRVGPSVGCKPYGTIRDQERSECECITHQEEPHHEFSVFHIIGTLSTSPPLLICNSCFCHNLFLFYLLLHRLWRRRTIFIYLPFPATGKQSFYSYNVKRKNTNR